GNPESFDFLGFTHFWSRSKKGIWVIKRKTARSRFRRVIGTITEWCRRNRHEPIGEQYQALRLKLLGHYQYYGVVGNGRSLWLLLERLQEVWQKWLSRRGGKKGSWEWFTRLLQRFPLPRPPGWVTPRVANR